MHILCIVLCFIIIHPTQKVYRKMLITGLISKSGAVELVNKRRITYFVLNQFSRVPSFANKIGSKLMLSSIELTTLNVRNRRNSQLDRADCKEIHR